MKKRVPRHGLFLFLPALLILIFSSIAHVYAGEKGVRDTIKNATAPVSSTTAVDISVARPDHVVQVIPKSNGKAFWTETRKDKVQRFKCGQCHTNGIVTAENAAAIAHGDIVLDHGGAQRPLACFTCHKVDDRDYFETEKGVTVDMDHVYELCGQCHFRQKLDWIGGAHGKRMDHWAGRRVVANCTSCHNPHAPLFKKRWPSTYSLPLE